MSTSSSDWSQLREVRNPVSSLTDSVLTSISDIIKSIVCVKTTKKDIFTEIGCYFYRASIVIMELNINWTTPTNTIEILQTLSKRVELAKSFAKKLEMNVQVVHSSEVKTIVQQLEDVLKSIGENLGLIPVGTFGENEYTQIAAKGLSRDMKDVSFGPELSGTTFEPRDKFEREVETDLYSVEAEVSAMNDAFSDTSRAYSLNDNSERLLERFDSKKSSVGSSLMALPQVAQYMEPLYETFFCPLTKKVMEDPVTVESGVTYERTAIIQWFDETEEMVCPKSGKKMTSITLNTNVALKATIEEWKERNEAARIKVARAALSLASTDNMVLEAINDLRALCKNKEYNKVHVRRGGMIPVIAKFLNYRSRSIRHGTVELLRQLAEDDDESKDDVARAIDVLAVIKMLSSSHRPIIHASALLLLELSLCPYFCLKIGTLTGAILMLITVKYKQSVDEFTSRKIDEILKNLETVPDNIKLMAENGHWEPLLTHLLEGSEEMRMEMASYLSEIELGPDHKTYVAERASPVLTQMVQTGNSIIRNAAFKALKKISGHHPNAKTLVEAGIMQTMVEEIFARTIHSEPMDSKVEASKILANILESGMDFENVCVNTHGHMMSSDYIVYNVVQGINHTTPDELNINLIRILQCLIKFPKASTTIVSVIKETDASYNLIELINSENVELGITSIRLMITLSAFMGHTLSDRLCKTKGLPEGLIRNEPEVTRITEKDAVSAIFLAKLPHQNLALNLALVNSNMVPGVVHGINRMRVSGTRSGRHTGGYLEGLVGILVRLTTTLYDHQMLQTARTHDFTTVFTELLTGSSTDEVQRLSALGLENLSRQSTTLSRPPRRMSSKILKIVLFRKCVSLNLKRKGSRAEEFATCGVHGGVCSSKETFCLVDAEAVERLIACLDHGNVGVIEAALSALSTLLEERVNMEKSVKMLSEKRCVEQVLSVIKEHKEEALWRKAFWVIERFFINGGDETVSRDRMLPTMLISALHNGDESMRPMAEKLLRHLNKMPNLSNTMTFTTIA